MSLFQTPSQTSASISPDLCDVLQKIVDEVVQQLGCIGAIATTLEDENALTVRASSFNMPPPVLKQYLKLSGLNLDDDAPVIYLDNARHRHNLSVHAIKNANGRSRPYQLSNRLYDLLRPLTGKRFSDQVQAELGIREVISIPFILREEVVGNLIAATKGNFAERDINILLAFGQQAAATIQSQYRLQAMAAYEQVVLRLQNRMTDETEVLQTIVDAVVHELGYSGAMVATLEEGNALPVRAYALESEPRILPMLEERAGISLIGPKAIVFLDQEKYSDNLSVKAVKGENGRPQKYITSSHLYDLLRPMADKQLAAFAQRLLGIKQVIAVPFYLHNEIVGNLFVASNKSTFTDWEVSLLVAFGQQAAAGIRNARLFQEAEKQRLIAQMFGRMAFSATASVHELGNHMGAIYTFVQMLTSYPQFSDHQREQLLSSSSAILERLDKANHLLENLHTPWQQKSENPISVNDALNRGLREVFPEILQELYQDIIVTEDNVTVTMDLMFDVPLISASPDMLTEAFRVLIKNAREAVCTSNKHRHLWISTKQLQEKWIEVTIRDSGTGIKPEHLAHIFEMGWSTKNGQGMGFGLFWTRDFIHGLNGRIEAQSTYGDGTTFRLMLPVN
ncbi:MAG: GAF domain-containing protein [Chloroflexi bacterium]|nr:GAF domain-containing protein [Chloroflexota bacterium]